MIQRKNPLCETYYELPEEVVVLMENKLSCKTDGYDKRGLRWVNNIDNIGCVFFEKITRQSLSIYILPSTKYDTWRNEKELKRILKENGCSEVINNVRYIKSKKRNELRLIDIHWMTAVKILPIIVSWVHKSQK